MKYIYGNPDKAHSWKDVASIFAAHDSLNSAQTSSLPLVQFWEPNGEFPCGNARELLRLCFETVNLENEFRNAELCFEYPVPVHEDCEGKGKASMTDLMIITDHHAIALEAKWTECGQRCSSIRDWETQKGAAIDNRGHVRDGWIKYINKYLEDKGFHILSPKEEDYRIIPYQMLHRIASACAVANKRKNEAIVVYQLFYNEQPTEGMKTITEKVVNKRAMELDKGYKALFNNERPVRFHIIKTKVEPCKPIKALEHLCPVDTSIAGRAKYDWNALFLEMQKSPIYTFSDIKLFPFDQK